MSGLGIQNLPVPPAEYRVARANERSLEAASFESEADARFEDITRSRLLNSCSKRNEEILNSDEARALAARLFASGEGRETPKTLASSLFMRGHRLRISGALWKLYDRSSAGAKPSTFTVIPRTWEFTPDRFADVDPRRLLAAFRTDLYQLGAAGCGGWLICFIHGEFEPIRGVFVLHLHGLASAEMVRILDKLSQLPRYSSRCKRQGDPPRSVYRRVRITRTALTNLPSPLTYLLQSFWPSRAFVEVSGSKPRRTRRKQRIPEPYHSQVLLWLDRWRLVDLALLIGLRVTRDGLTSTR